MRRIKWGVSLTLLAEVVANQRPRYAFLPSDAPVPGLAPGQSSPINRCKSIFETKSTMDDQERPRTNRFRNAPLVVIAITLDWPLPSCVHLRSGALWALSPDALARDEISDPWRFGLKGCCRFVPRPAKNGAPWSLWWSRRQVPQLNSVNVRPSTRVSSNRAQGSWSRAKWRFEPRENRHLPPFFTTFVTVFSGFWGVLFPSGRK
jgi:hypothetical protein